MTIDTKGLSILTAEALELGNRSHLSKQQERRYRAVIAGISAIKAGATLQEVDQERLNQEEIAAGLTPTRLRTGRLNAEQRAKAVFMQELFKGGTSVGAKEVCGGYEFRAGETEGNALTGIGTYTGLGIFVPTDFYANVVSSMVEHDALYDEDVVTVTKSTNGHPLRIGNYDDGANEATLVGEASDQTGNQVDLGNPDQTVLGAYSYRTPIHKFSMEVFDDLEASYTAYALFERFASDRMARGIGKILVTGNGVNQTTGLITALELLGAPSVTASGSGANDGVGSSPVGSADMANLWGSVNRQYRESPKAGWLMNDSTLTALSAIVTKYGQPLVDFRTGCPMILNKPVHVSPSMPSTGSKVAGPVVFGDLSYWFTRLVSDQMTRIRVLKETYIENGQYGIQMFMRADGALNYTGGAPNSPMSYLICHS